VADRGAWTTPPEPSRRYRTRDRLLDARNGRADARKRIPWVPRPSAAPPEPTDAPPEQRAAAGFSPVEGPAPPPYITPYLDELRNACNQEVAGELTRYLAIRGQLHERLFEAEVRRAPLAYAMEFAATRLSEASTPLTERELSRRGPAEQDEQKWPAEMLRERRERAWRLTRIQAEEVLRKVTAELRVSDLAVEHAHVALEEHGKIAQAAALQIVHYYRRREAVYLRALSRTHENPPGLVQMLQLTGPQLPEWLLRSEAEKEGS
jgi:hypothetical protein